MDRLSDYDYHLPVEAIAQEPLADREQSRLLVLDKRTGSLQHRRFYEVPDLLDAGDLLVVNDTRVTALRILGRKQSGGHVEMLLLRETAHGEFVVLAKPGRRLQPGALVEFDQGVTAEVLTALESGEKLVRLSATSDLHEALTRIGQVPLPPYIAKRIEEPERYQTVYGQTPGSAAAPTAGLHFTADLLDQLRAKGTGIATVTLDVGLDTFRPILVEDLDRHRMHGEVCSVPEETARAVRECKGRIIAVGTTAVRTLESFAVGPRRVEVGQQETHLFIRPGYRFQIVDGMFTNFHMPRTTMLMLISAIAGKDNVLRSYAQALATGYRFLSFGDAMIIL